MSFESEADLPTPLVSPQVDTEGQLPWLMGAEVDSDIVDVPLALNGVPPFLSLHTTERHVIPRLNTEVHGKILTLAVILNFTKRSNPLTKGGIVKKACNNKLDSRAGEYYTVLEQMIRDKLIVLDDEQAFYRSNQRWANANTSSPYLDISQLGLQVATEEARRKLYGANGQRQPSAVELRRAAQVYAIGSRALITGRYKFLPQPAIQ